jgi:hypothetical protein
MSVCLSVKGIDKPTLKPPVLPEHGAENSEERQLASKNEQQQRK